MAKNYRVLFSNIFEFELEDPAVVVDNYYSFLYWRQSPRGSVKFGITHLPWERLRMQQQGTDESIQFDHLWIIKSRSEGFIKSLEEQLKIHFKERCLHNITKRGGHTEWYTKLSIKEFKASLVEKFSVLTEDGYYTGSIKKIRLQKPYTATKSSECPFKSPSNSQYHTRRDINNWASDFWDKLPDSLLLNFK